MFDFDSLSPAIVCRAVPCVGDLVLDELLSVDMLPGFSAASPVKRGDEGRT